MLGELIDNFRGGRVLNILRSQQGNMLVSVLMAAGLVSVVGMGMASVISNGSKSMNKVRIGQDALGLQSLVREQLKYEDICSDVVKTKKLNVDSDSQPFELQINDMNLKAGTDLPNYKLSIVSLNLENTKLSKHAYRDQDVAVGELRMQIEGAEGSSFRSLSLGGISLVMDSAQNITGCFQAESQEQNCHNMGGTYNATGEPKCALCEKNHLASYDGTGKLKCFNLASCYSGQTLGVGIDGGLKCLDLPQPKIVTELASNNDKPANSKSKSEKCSASPAICNAYQSLLGRNPDSSGAHYYQAQYDAAISAGKTAAQAAADIERAIKNGVEYQTGKYTGKEAEGGKEYAKTTNTSLTQKCTGSKCDYGGDSAALDSFYASTFGRKPDAEGKAYYMNQLQNGRSLADIQKELEYNKKNHGAK